LDKIDKVPFSRLTSNLGGRAQWFLTELVVIVAGILIALAIDEWRENNERRKAETEYLHQVVADLRTTEERMEAAIVNNAASENATTRLVAVFEGGETAEADSISKLLGEMLLYNNRVPVLGTIAALVSTGDLALIRSASARSEITDYLSQTNDYHVKPLYQFEERYREAYHRLLALAAIHGISPAHRSGPHHSLIEADVIGFLANPEAYVELMKFRDLKLEDFVYYRESVQGDSKRLRESLAQLVSAEQ
jgi:hypothetical protein